MNKTLTHHIRSNFPGNRNKVLPDFQIILLLAAVTLLLTVAVAHTLGLREVLAVISDNDLGQRLNSPRHVFVDKKTGEVYTLTSGKNQLVVYDADLLPLMSLGPGRDIETPTGVYVDARGLLYVSQRAGKGKPHRLTVLNAAFIPLKEINLSNYTLEENKAFLPFNLAVSKRGRIYITGEVSSKVLVLDEKGNFLYWFIPAEEGRRQNLNHEDLELDTPAAEESKEAEIIEEEVIVEEIVEDEFEIPEHLLPYEVGEEAVEVVKEPPQETRIPAINNITIDKEGKLYFVSQQSGQIYVYDEDESYLFSFGTKGGSTGKLSRPQAVAVDEANELIYVVDYMRHNILTYNLDGKFQFETGGRGTSPGWFNHPTSIGTDSQGLIFVADYFNHRIQVLRLKLDPAAF
jgi:DNA-binding beta-propeller fold protein YncE